MKRPIPRPPFAYLPDGDGPALCRRVCNRLKTGGKAFAGVASVDGVRLCRRFCRGFASGLPAVVVRRRRAGKGGR